MSANPNQGPTGGLTPHIAIADKRASEAIEFYIKAFGATENMRIPADDGVRLMHAHLTINGASLMMHDEFPEYVENESGPPDGVTLHLQVDDADAWFDRAVAAGATVVMPLDNMFWGDRYAQIKDPFGHQWSIGAPIEGEK
jgi:PhnB protein